MNAIDFFTLNNYLETIVPECTDALHYSLKKLHKENLNAYNLKPILNSVD